MKKGLLFLFVISLTTQAKIFTKKYPTWEISCTIDHGQIIPNTRIIVSFSGDKEIIKEIDGIYTEDKCIECEASSIIIKKIKYKIQNEEGILNPKNKNMPHVSVVDVSLADEIKIGSQKFSVEEEVSSYTLSSEEGVIFPQGSIVYPHTIMGEPLSVSLKVPKDALLDMYNIETKEFAFNGRCFPAIMMYENGRAEGLLSVDPTHTEIDEAELYLNTGEKIVYGGIGKKDSYALTKDGTKLLSGWYEKFKTRTKPNEGETLTQYYHRAYTADSLFKIQEEKDRIEYRKRASELKKAEEERHKLYPEYNYSKSVQYFNPKEEELRNTSSNIFSVNTHITYDVKKKQYTCYSDRSIKITFTVDQNGYRKSEILYYNSNTDPKYRNEYTWYINGVIESIKSYDYSTNEIFLVCHFFSDGKLRSAYKYGIGNSGKNVLRKSKESHPTFGGYTCKLYDLNGKYERSISWDIGTGFLGGDKQLAPDRLDFNKLIPVN